MSQYQMDMSPSILRPRAFSVDGDGGNVSRREKVYTAIEGDAPGFGTINPWVPVLDFDEAVTNQIASQHGSAFILQLSDPFFGLDSERLVLMWDDEVVAAGPMNVQEGDTIVVTVPDARGERLSVWCTDTLAINVLKSGPASLANQFRAEVAGKAVADSPLNVARDAASSALGAGKTVAIVGVLAAAVLGYFLLKDKV